MKTNAEISLKDLIAKYDSVMRVMEHNAAKAISEDHRAYGGYIRMAKGQIQEFITERLMEVAWVDEMEMPKSRIHINSSKISIPIRRSYAEKLKDSFAREYILNNIEDFAYGLSVDKHLFVDGKFVLGIECKAYTENAMIKRILVDFHLLKTQYPDLKCMLFQLESQLGGSYSKLTNEPPYGSYPTHTLMSYFEDVELKVVTLLQGERKIDRPINKAEYFKPLKLENLEPALMAVVESLKEYSA